MRNIVPLLMLLVLPGFLSAQTARSERQKNKREKVNEAIRLQEEGVITHRKSFVFGPKLTNDGYGISFELGRASSIEKALLFQIDIAERKHPKEMKVGSKYPYGTSLIYGKENYFYPVKAGVQQQILLGNKSNKNGVSVTGNVGGGLALGFLRPYFAQIDDGTGGIKYIKYNSPDSASFLDYGVLAGGPPFNKGWNELSVVPGVYGKAALRFDYGRFNEIVTAIEVGITGEYYSKKIPQMVFVKEKQFFFGAYCAILFGKRK